MEKIFINPSAVFVEIREALHNLRQAYGWQMRGNESVEMTKH
jgi:hypothetical protein